MARRDHKADHERLLDEIRDLMDDYEDRGHVDEDSLNSGTRPHGTYPVFREHDRASIGEL